MTHDDRDPSSWLGITRVLDAPRELVFRVWTTPAHLLRWWGPKDFTAHSLEADVREGGAWRACIRGPDGTEYWHGGTYHELVSPERIVFSFRWEEQGAIDTRIEVVLEDIGDDRTLLSFRQSPFESQDERDSHLEGWSECMDRLQAYAATIDGASA